MLYSRYLISCMCSIYMSVFLYIRACAHISENALSYLLEQIPVTRPASLSIFSLEVGFAKISEITSGAEFFLILETNSLTSLVEETEFEFTSTSGIRVCASSFCCCFNICCCCIIMFCCIINIWGEWCM